VTRETPTPKESYDLWNKSNRKLIKTLSMLDTQTFSMRSRIS